jgi:hypothetical protein
MITEEAMSNPRLINAWALLTVFTAGCGKKSEPPADTGAREAVQTYFEALIHQDWNQAYSLLDVDSKKRCNQEQFARLAQNYQRNLGFDPAKVIVQFCQENGDEATAHVVFTGGGRRRGAVVLRHTDAGWGVVLPSNFGLVN